MKYLIILAFIQISISDSVQCHKETGLVVDCTSTYDPVCGYNTDKQKLETFTNGCIGCYYSGNVSYYISGPCVVSSSVGSQNITNKTKYECSIQRPDLQYSCNNTQSVVCAQLTYDGSTSEREFNNDCQACNNSDVASYSSILQFCFLFIIFDLVDQHNFFIFSFNSFLSQKVRSIDLVKYQNVIVIKLFWG